MQTKLAMLLALWRTRFGAWVECELISPGQDTEPYLFRARRAAGDPLIELAVPREVARFERETVLDLFRQSMDDAIAGAGRRLAMRSVFGPTSPLLADEDARQSNQG